MSDIAAKPALSPGELEALRALLAAHVPQCKAVVFGSRAKGTANPCSDLDLALIGPEKLAPGVLSDLRYAFMESDLPFRVDVLDYHAVPGHFRQAMDEGVVIKPNA